MKEMIKKVIKKMTGSAYKPIRSGIICMGHAISVLCFYISGTYFSNMRKLKRLKNAYLGKRCFVICNGPSLKAEDLTKIHKYGDISIGMNAIPRIYGKTPWRPTFLSATDDVVFTPENKEMVKQCECGMKLYDRSRYLKSLGAKGNLLYLSFNESAELLDKPCFDSDITKKLPSIGTSAYSMIEFAVYLGCSEIYILGCDMSYSVNLHRDGSITYNESGKEHFYGKDVDSHIISRLKPNLTWQLEIAFEYIAGYAREHNIKIYNATRGGKLEYFERVGFDSLF